MSNCSEYNFVQNSCKVKHRTTSIFCWQWKTLFRLGRLGAPDWLLTWSHELICIGLHFFCINKTWQKFQKEQTWGKKSIGKTVYTYILWFFSSYCVFAKQQQIFKTVYLFNSHYLLLSYVTGDRFRRFIYPFFIVFFFFGVICFSVFCRLWTLIFLYLNNLP